MNNNNNKINPKFPRISFRAITKRLIKLFLYSSLIVILFVAALSLFRFYVLPKFKQYREYKAGKTSSILSKARTTDFSMINMNNVFFRLNDDIAMDVITLFGKIMPLKTRDNINFDDVSSFVVDIYTAKIKMGSDALANLFNKYVFNYPGSPVRNMSVKFIEAELNGVKVPRMKITGEMNFGPENLKTWIGFEMISWSSINTKDNTMIIETDAIKSMGNPYTKTVMGILGIKLESITHFPKSSGVMVVGNQLIIHPFKIFPPPLMNGSLSHLEINLKSNSLDLSLDNGQKLNMPPTNIPGQNYVRLKQGVVSFGRVVMHDADLIMLDKDPSDFFDFYLDKYLNALTKGSSHVQLDGSIIAYLPDYKDAIK